MKISRYITLFVSLLINFNSEASSFNVERWVTDNGVKVVFYPAMEVPMLDISMAFAAGSAYDKKLYGLGSLTAQMLNEGSAGQSSIELADKLDFTGAQFTIETNREMSVFNLRTLINKQALDPAVRIFTQIITKPDFPNQALAREKKQLNLALEQRTNNPEQLATDVFFTHLYQNHPYAHPVNGTTESINAIKTQDIIQFYKQYYVGNNAVLVLVGALDSQSAHKIADIITHDLTPGNAPPAISMAKSLTKSQTIRIPFPSSQTLFRLGQLGIDYKNTHYFPLMVGNYILGGGSLVSRLAIELREHNGLTYTIDSKIVPMPGVGPFIVSFSTQNQQAQNALSLTQKVIQEYVTQGPSQQELEAAKKFLTGSFSLSLASNRTIATLLLRMTMYQLPEDFLDNYTNQIKKVTAEDIKRVFQAEIHPEQFLNIEVGAS